MKNACDLIEKVGGVSQSSCDTLRDLQKQFVTLEGLKVTSFPLVNSVTVVEETINAIVSKGTAAAFVTYDYEFRRNWATFAEIMNHHPDWKIANNFESKDTFGVRREGYLFTAGLPERYCRRFEGRL